jgi:hypothetical protein
MQVLVLIVLAFTLIANEAAGYNRLGAGTASCGIWTGFRREGSTSARALSSELAVGVHRRNYRGKLWVSRSLERDGCRKRLGVD